ncbi:type I restriction endonuclease, partial [Sporomusa ovata]
MPNFISEEDIEQAAIKKLVQENDYDFLNCMTAEPETLPDGSGRDNKKQVILPTVLFNSLCDINPNLPVEVIRKVADELMKTPASAVIMQENYRNYNKLRNGILVEYEKNGRKTPDRLKVIDFERPTQNRFTVVSQLWIKGEVHWRRPDLIIYINGLPGARIKIVQIKYGKFP